jgi:hypothetical protein
MAILVNMGKRGFVLKEGFLKPGDQLTVDAETAQKLTKAYPNEIKEIVVKAEEVKKAVAETTEEPKVEEPAEEKPAKKTSRRKKSSK